MNHPKTTLSRAAPGAAVAAAPKPPHNLLTAPAPKAPRFPETAPTNTALRTAGLCCCRKVRYSSAERTGDLFLLYLIYKGMFSK